MMKLVKMKYIIVLGDGMADEPIQSLDNKTPLEYAHTPGMDYIASNGVVGRLVTVPDGYSPGSEIANLGILGYDVRKVYEGRGSLEAASIGVEIADNEVAMRMNLICVENGKIKNHSAGHISTEEAAQLIDALRENMGDDLTKFDVGVSYRHLLRLGNADKRVKCTPPHDVPGVEFMNVMPVAETPEAEPTAARMRELILKSYDILQNHPVNVARRKTGKDSANMLWPWSLGRRPSMLPLSELYGVGKGTVISAVDLIKGIGIYAGLKSVDVEGATGLYDTNYENKLKATIDALESGDDFVFLHVEASDEAGHEGDVALKVKTIENLDSRIIEPLTQYIKKSNEEIAIAVLPDHPTPCRIKTHTSHPVPFAVMKPGVKPDSAKRLTETAGAESSLSLSEPMDFITYFLQK